MSSLCQEAAAMPSATVKLVSSDAQAFDVEREIVEPSVTISNLLEDTDDQNATVPLPNVKGNVLAKVSEYLHKMHEHKDALEGDHFKEFNSTFMEELDQSTLFDLILAANYLNIKTLLDSACQEVANMIKGKTPEEIRRTFNIKNDFTPEEEEEVRRASQSHRRPPYPGRGGSQRGRVVDQEANYSHH